MNLFKYMLDILIAVLVMFIYVSMNFLQKQDVLIQEHIKIITKEFVNNVSVHGYITIQMYENFLDKIQLSGRYYNIELSHEQIRYVPEYNNKIFTGEICIYRENYYEDEILDKIYDKGIYWFEINDYLTVRVMGKVDWEESGLLKNLFRTSYNCITECFGIIRDIALVIA